MALTPISKLIDNKKNTIMGYDRYDVEEGVRNLKRAAEIKADPQFLKAIQYEAERQVEALKGVAKNEPEKRRGGV